MHKSQSILRTYRPNLPTSLTYILLHAERARHRSALAVKGAREPSTKGFEPWRPDADMSTVTGVASVGLLRCVASVKCTVRAYTEA